MGRRALFVMDNLVVTREIVNKVFKRDSLVIFLYKAPIPGFAISDVSNCGLPALSYNFLVLEILLQISRDVQALQGVLLRLPVLWLSILIFISIILFLFTAIV